MESVESVAEKMKKKLLGMKLKGLKYDKYPERELEDPHCTETIQYFFEKEFRCFKEIVSEIKINLNNIFLL